MGRNLQIACILQKAGAFIRKDFLEQTSYRFHFFLMLWGVFFSVVMFHFLSALIPGQTSAALQRYGGDYFSFVLIGLAFSQYFDHALNGMKRKIQEAQMAGTLEALLTTRTGSGTILALSTGYQYLFTSFMAAVYLLAGWLVFDVPLGGANWGAAAVVFVLTITSFLSFGILSAAVILLFKRGDPVAWALQTFSFLVAGVYYPIEVLPDWVQSLARFLPLTHALRGLRESLLAGKGLGDLGGEIAALVIFTVVLLPLGLGVFRAALDRARREGTLSHF
ncbi:MAG: ABC transporter permease [Kiritimatiellae bacterium]|nr:ABC transporter permease [Kiritimatiellia bacterium]